MSIGEYAGGLAVAYENALAAQDPELADTVSGAQRFGEDYISALARVVNTYVLADSQRKLLNVQLDRARQGLPPLDSSQYGLGANVSVGFSPDTLKLVGYGALGLLALFAVSTFSRGRK